MTLAESFRRLIAQGLKRGEYLPWHDKGIDLIDRIKTLDEFMGCLNALCEEFDPAKPPREAGLKSGEPPQWKTEPYALCVALLEVLLLRGLEIASNDNAIATIIVHFVEIEAGKRAGSGRLLIYASRFHEIQEIQRNAIAQEALRKQAELEKQHRDARYLIDDLANVFKNKTGKPHQSFEELYQFDVGDEAGRTKFLQLAAACEKTWRAALKDKDYPAAAGKMVKAFQAFQLYVRKELQQPADMFRLLKWAREPGEATSVPMKGGGTQRVETGASQSASKYFLSVKEELYLEIATYGMHQVASDGWHYDTALQAVHRLRMTGADADWRTALSSGATGFAGNDAKYVYGPFLKPERPEVANLFRARLLGAQADPYKFFNLQNQRRCLEILAERKHLRLVDELTLARMSVQLKSLMKADPEAVSARSCRVQKYGKDYGTWRIGDGYPDAFSIYWIDPEPDGTTRVYIEFDRHPGFIFSTVPNNALGELVEAAQFADVGESLEALKILAVTYLMVLGFALDVISAGIAGNTLRGAVLYFLGEQIAQRVASKTLELTGLDHPVLEFIVGAIVGSRFGKPRKLLSLEEIEEIERSAIRGVSRPAKAAARESGKEALDAAVSKETKSLPDAPGNKIGEHFYKHSEHVYSVDQMPRAYRDLPQAEKDKLIKEGLAEFADEEESFLDRMTERAGRMLGSDEAPAGAVPVAAGVPGSGVGAVGSGDPKGIMARLAGTAKAVVKGKGAKGGSGIKAYAPNASQTKFQNSRLFNRLDSYLEYLPADAQNALRKERTQLLQQLGGSRPSISMKDARKQMMNIINEAKESYGELQGEMVARSNFNISSSVHIPLRGEEGAPMLDWVGRVKGGKLKFVLVEAKGGARTRLGRISEKVYHFVGNRLEIKWSSSDKVVKQASGEWYYQKCAEIFMSGQALEAKDAVEAAARKKLAIELFHAAEDGKVGSIISKFGLDDETINVNTDEVINFFAKNKPWDWSKGFPI